MRSEEERLARMHRRARALQRQRDRSALQVWGGASMALFLCLLGLTPAFDTGHGLTGDVSAGASLLSDGAGGYVLTAVLAFMAGVILTAVLLRRKKKDAEDLSGE